MFRSTIVMLTSMNNQKFVLIHGLDSSGVLVKLMVMRYAAAVKLLVVLMQTMVPLL